MAENGKFANLSCHTGPTDTTTFKATERQPDGTTVNVSGSEDAHGTIKGDWQVTERGKTAVHVASDGSVSGRLAASHPEIARDNAKEILSKTAKSCKRGLDLRLI